MDADLLFTVCSRSVLPAWLLLLLAPKWQWTHRLVFHAWIPALLAVAYIYCFAMAGPAPEGASFRSLQGILIFFQVPYVALAGWIHYLAFDLFVGAWMVRDAQRRGLSHWWLVPCLPLTLMLGPAGLLTYFIVRFALTKTLTTRETATA